MPIIRDGKTPNGRLVKCRPTVMMPSQCVTRKMTEEERAFYGEAIPPSEWKKPPKYGSVIVEGKPKPKKVTFQDDDDFRRMIKRERLRRNMTQERVAIFAQMSSSEYSKLERGAKSVTASLRKRICDVYGWEEE